MRTMASRLLVIVVACLIGGVVTAAPATPQAAGVTFTGAGDIASCYDDHDAATAALVDAIGGAVFTLGDNVYDRGSPAEYAACYDPTWGRFLDRTWPVPGNHDYYTPGAAGYFGYFGARAGNPDEGWYSFDLGGWHVVALNSNCAEIGGCGPGSPQLAWLEADLAAHPATCTVALSHHPYVSSAGHADDVDMGPIWATLQRYGVELLLSGHDHTYERFAPQDAGGRVDPHGVVQVVVGTGGAPLRDFETIAPNSVARSGDIHGVLTLTLRADGYDWAFLPVAGESITDAGSAACH